MGGAAGHMQGMHEDLSLTIKEIKDIFEKISSGKMMVTEKLDGVCLHLSFSVVDGKARAARNYKNINEGGITLTFDGSVRRDFLFVEDAVKIIEQVCLKKPVGVFNLSSNYGLETDVFIKSLISGYEYGGKINRNGNEIYRQFILDNSKLEDFDNILENLDNSYLALYQSKCPNR